MSTAATATATASALTNLILKSTNRQSLIKSLICPSIHWTPLLVNTILKHLWNHGPKALQFFDVLLQNHPTYVHSASSFDHAIDVAARLRNYTTVFTLLHRMRSLRLHPTPKTFAIIAERFTTRSKCLALALAFTKFCKLNKFLPIRGVYFCECQVAASSLVACSMVRSLKVNTTEKDYQRKKNQVLIKDSWSVAYRLLLREDRRETMRS
ncbi:pentatricopeptide repeat-containing protein At1g74900, mitochondrial isoform X2 [Gossypium hirsutum]|uniref:Pentatricopeptide repeat-containing protein At1g74900, mitochondrial isoform X2 n=1 Tax=Gossypium hirsutum TaxID=3635 RepID=A0ABM3BYJ1_GOSHI|nr:pentatricopeptide repeat-containing protein At1g74900, mitochondrial-like isoform X2 [Gossypium hirsutum]